jgi:hypothetical protein
MYVLGGVNGFKLVGAVDVEFEPNSQQQDKIPND